MDLTRTLTNEFLKSVLSDAVVGKSWCTNLNEAKAAGVYSVTAPCSNLPQGAYSYGTLAVFVSNTYCFQLYVTDMSNVEGEYIRSPIVYIRSFSEQYFSFWVQTTPL